MAVGRMTMSSGLVEKSDKGKAVITLHTYGDMLWEKGGKLEPPKEPTILRPTDQLPALEVREGDPTNLARADNSETVEEPTREQDFNVPSGSQQPAQAPGETSSPDYSPSGMPPR